MGVGHKAKPSRQLAAQELLCPGSLYPSRASGTLVPIKKEGRTVRSTVARSSRHIDDDVPDPPGLLWRCCLRRWALKGSDDDESGCPGADQSEEEVADAAASADGPGLTGRDPVAF